MSEERRRRESTKMKRLERKLKVVEKRDRMLEKDRTSERAVLEEVFDRTTIMTIYKFMNNEIIDEIYGVVKAGKEARIYWGKAPNGEELAIKIYLISAAEFRKGMLPYIVGDPRFVGIRRDSRSLIYAWAQKEFKNLQRAQNSGVRVPKPIAVEKNVLVMEFVGKNGVSAPILKEVSLRNPKRVYRQLLRYLKKLYQKGGLVHADLSEYNIMAWKGKPVIFDVSQSVTVEHPMAGRYLRRDLQNINKYFKKLDIEVLSIEEGYKRVTGGR